MELAAVEPLMEMSTYLRNFLFDIFVVDFKLSVSCSGLRHFCEVSLVAQTNGKQLENYDM